MISTVQVHEGFGRSIQYLQPHQIENIRHLRAADTLLNIIGTLFVRISVCLFIWRLIPANRKSYRTWLYGCILLFTAISIVTGLAFIFQCIPMRGIWEQNIKAHCLAESILLKIAQAQAGIKRKIISSPEYQLTRNQLSLASWTSSVSCCHLSSFATYK